MIGCETVGDGAWLLKQPSMRVLHMHGVVAGIDRFAGAALMR